MSQTNAEQAVLVTTTFAKQPSDFRFGLAKRTIAEAVRLGYMIIVVDGSPDPEIRKIMEGLGAEVHIEEKRGMGNSRRQAFKHGRSAGKKVVVWTEPEKYPMVPCLDPLVEEVLHDKADLAIPRRRNLDGYPPYQHFSELRANHELGNITGRGDLDLMVGPRVMSRRALVQFLGYTEEFAQQNQLDDNWGILFFPVLQLLQLGQSLGLKVVSKVVDYVHPPEQTAVETDSPDMNEKRDLQREKLVAGMQKAAAIYGFHGA